MAAGRDKFQGLTRLGTKARIPMRRHMFQFQGGRTARPNNRDSANSTTGIPTGFKIKSR